jgi:hypothetical protein
VIAPIASSPIWGSTDSSVVVPPPSSGTLSLRPAASYCFMNCRARRPTKRASTASLSRRIWARNGLKSLVLNGVQIFCTICPPLSSNVRWKPPTVSHPNA